MHLKCHLLEKLQKEFYKMKMYVTSASIVYPANGGRYRFSMIVSANRDVFYSFYHEQMTALSTTVDELVPTLSQEQLSRNQEPR